MARCQPSRHFRVVRPDMRGFGRSTPMARDFPWTLDIVIGDFVRLMDALGIEHFHLVGAKIGGTIARAFAARRPERVLTLTVVGTPPPMREVQLNAHPSSPRNSNRTALSTGRAARWQAASAAPSPPKVLSGGSNSWDVPRSRPRSAS